MPQLRQLVSGFDPRSGREGFVVDIVGVSLALLRVLLFCPVSTVPLLLHIHRCYSILAPACAVNSDNLTVSVGKGKGIAIPLQSWIDPEGSRRLRLPDFKTIGT